MIKLMKTWKLIVFKNAIKKYNAKNKNVKYQKCIKKMPYIKCLILMPLY